MLVLCRSLGGYCTSTFHSDAGLGGRLVLYFMVCDPSILYFPLYLSLSQQSSIIVLHRDLHVDWANLN